MLLCCWWYLLWVLDENENYIFLIITLHASYGCRLTWRVSVQGRSCSQPSGSADPDDHQQIPFKSLLFIPNDPIENQDYYTSTPVPKISSFAPDRWPRSTCKQGSRTPSSNMHKRRFIWPCMYVHVKYLEVARKLARRYRLYRIFATVKNRRPINVL